MLWRLFFLALVAHASGLNIVCYYTNWAQYRPAPWTYLPENVDPSLCTHISYAFCKPVGLDIQIFEHNDETMYTRIMDLKKQNPNVKILLAIGGAGMASAPFLQLASNANNRMEFSKNAVKFMRQRHFDGFEMDWEYPDASQKDNFAELIKQLRATFEADATESGKPRLELGVAVAAGKDTIDMGIDIPKVATHADFLNIMTYDFHGSWENFVGFNSPLYPYTGETGAARNLNLDWVAKYYVSQGAPKEKLNLGVASYGRSFTLSNPSAHDVLSSASTGPMCTYTRQAGIMSYYEVCDFIKSGGRVVQVESQGNPYAIKDSVWVGYDDVASAMKKAVYAKDNGYAGIIFWTLDYDDFTNGICGEGRYPLLNAVKKGLGQGSSGSGSPGSDTGKQPGSPGSDTGKHDPMTPTTSSPSVASHHFEGKLLWLETLLVVWSVVGGLSSD